MLAVAAGALVAIPAAAQTSSGALAGAGTIPGLNPKSRRSAVLPVRGNIYVLMGAGANITLSVGLDGVLTVDSGSAEMSDQVLAAIRGVQQWVEAKAAASAPPLLYGAETRNSIVEARRADLPPQADSLYRRHEHRGRSHRRQRRARQLGQDVHGRQRRRPVERRQPGRRDSRARKPAEPDGTNPHRGPAGVPDTRAPDRHMTTPTR